MSLTRRSFLIAAPAFLASCTHGQIAGGPDGILPSLGIDVGSNGRYGARTNEPHPVPAINTSKINPKFLRREVAYDGSEAPGTVIVDTAQRFAYLVQPGGRAIRYGVGVGKTEALAFRGSAVIGRKAKWPQWTPTANMIRREPARYGKVAGGMPGGARNPLGPRALYLYRGGRDTYFRLHGTTEPQTIGTMVSSGCVRFMNQDIIDLYERVPVGARVIVRSNAGS